MKKLMQYTLLFTTLMAHSIFSYAGDNMLHVSKEVVVNASAAEAWELVGDFNSLNKWHPAVKTSKLNGNVRLFTLTDGTAIYDELTVYNAAEKSYTYRLIKAPLPLYGYLGSMIVKDNGNKTSTITWQSRFYADGVSDAEAIKIINGVYDGGLQSLKAHFNQ
jgi:mxaD protein